MSPRPAKAHNYVPPATLISKITSMLERWYARYGPPIVWLSPDLDTIYSILTVLQFLANLHDQTCLCFEENIKASAKLALGSEGHPSDVDLILLLS